MAIVERLAILIDAQTGGAISDLNRLNAEINKVNRTQQEATGLTGAFDRGLKKIGIESNNTAALLKAGVAAGATAAGYAMLRFSKDAVRSTVEFTDAVRSISQVTGATAEQASKLNAILDDYGISGESASKSFSRLARNIETNESSLRKFGIEVVRNSDDTVNLERTIASVAEAYKNTADPAQRAALVNQAFGRSGSDLIPILEQGAEGIKKLYAAVPEGQILSQRDLDNALEYKLAVDNLSDSFLELKVGLGNLLIPALTDTANTLATLVRTFQEVDDLTGSLGFSIGDLTGNIVQFIPGVGEAYRAVEGLGKILGGGSEESKKLADARQLVTEKTQALAAAAAEGDKSNREMRDLRRELTDATDAYDRVQRRVNDELDRAKSATDAVTGSMREQLLTAYELATSQLGVEGAQLSLERAQQRYNEVLAENAPTSLEAREAYNALQLAALNYGKQVEDAATKVGDSTEDASRRQVVALRAVADSLAPDNPLRKYLDEYIYRLNVDLPAEKQTILTIDYDKAALAELENYLIGLGLQTPPGRAMGGPVETGKAYIVGERGPEMFVPNTAGRIVPNSAFATQSAEPSAQGGSVATIVVPVSLDGRVVTEVVAANLNRAGGPVISSRAIV